MAKTGSTGSKAGRRLRSQLWFDNPDNPGMTALYIERYLNYGLTREELMSGKPIVGIAQSGSDLSPCNRHHLDLAHRVREGRAREQRRNAESRQHHLRLHRILVFLWSSPALQLAWNDALHKNPLGHKKVFRIKCLMSFLCAGLIPP